jgi:hypothetical protein
MRVRRGRWAIGAAVALLAALGPGAGTPPVTAQEITVGNASARHSSDGMGAQGTDPGTVTVMTGADPLGVAPFHITITCDNGVTQTYDVAAETEFVAYETTAADGLDVVICEVTQADTVVYESFSGEQSSSGCAGDPIPCPPWTTRITFSNQIPPVAELTMVKRTNGEDAATPDDAVVFAADEAGAAITWTYELTNTGTLQVYGDTVEVVDDREGPVTCVVPAIFLPGESVTCEPLTGIATDASYANTVTVTAEGGACELLCPRLDVATSDTSHYRLVGGVPSTDPADPADPDDPPGPTAPPARPIRTAAAFTG